MGRGRKFNTAYKCACDAFKSMIRQIVHRYMGDEVRAKSEVTDFVKTRQTRLMLGNLQRNMMIREDMAATVTEINPV